jgi:hypothetical protein
MRTLWFLVFVLWSNSVFGQLQKFEDLAALYDLNQNEIEQNAGFSCMIHINYVEVTKRTTEGAEKTYTVAREQYLRLVEKGNKRRVDSISGESRSDLGSSRSNAPGLLRIDSKPPGLLRNDLQTGDKDLTLLDGGVVDRSLNFHQYGFWQSVFHLPQLWASAITSLERWPKDKAPVDCAQRKVNGTTQWHALQSPRDYVMVVEFDDKVEFLPVKISRFEATYLTSFRKETFDGVDTTWKKKSEAKIQWQKLGSGLYGPKSLWIHTKSFDDHTMSIYFTDWKIGDAVDSSLLDEAEFRKLDKKTFPYGDLIKAFPEHPPTVLK